VTIADAAGNKTVGTDNVFDTTDVPVVVQEDNAPQSGHRQNIIGGGGAVFSSFLLPSECMPGHLLSILTGKPCPVMLSPNSVGVSDPAPTSGPSVIFTKDLYFLLIDTDVMQLQKFLNTHGFVLANYGPGSPGNETNKFGSATRYELGQFQKANGITPSAGYFGPVTRKFVNNILFSEKK
jgi:hypothetical protein